MKNFLKWFGISVFGLVIAVPAQAVCPVCTVAVAAGVGLSRYLGIDDTIAGVWIGGLTVSLIMWTINWLEGKNKKFRGSGAIIAVSYYALIVLPLHFTSLLGHPLNTLWGIDKLLLGIVLGSVVFYLSSAWYVQIKTKRGKPHFPFQKVVMPVVAMTLMSLIFFFITKY